MQPERITTGLYATRDMKTLRIIAVDRERNEATYIACGSPIKIVDTIEAVAKLIVGKVRSDPQWGKR